MCESLHVFAALAPKIASFVAAARPRSLSHRP